MRRLGTYGYEDSELCEACYRKYSSKKPDNAESEDADVAKAATKGDITAIVQGAGLTIKLLRTLPIDERIAKLEELLAEKLETTSEMEPALDAWKGVLQKELDKLKASKEGIS